VVADLAIPEDCTRVVSEVVERLGRLDILVNNAGISIRRHTLLTTPDEVERVMRVNFFSAVHMSMAALPGMVERKRGAVVNITSVAGYIPNPKESAYGASKAALSLWSHVAHVDLAGSGVHVGVLSPGPIDTEIWAKDEEAAYHGPKFPAQVVADGVAQIVEKNLVHLTVPRRYGAMAPLYALPGISRAVRRGLIRFGQAGEKQR
jgi:short-subunit dehydrogenase